MNVASFNCLSRIIIICTRKLYGVITIVNMVVRYTGKIVRRVHSIWQEWPKAIVSTLRLPVWGLSQLWILLTVRVVGLARSMRPPLRGRIIALRVTFSTRVVVVVCFSWGATPMVMDASCCETLSDRAVTTVLRRGAGYIGRRVQIR